jgi:hypothetical protein
MAASASSVGRHLLHIDEGRLHRQASLHRSEKSDGIPDEEAPRFAVILPENRVSPDRDVRQVGGWEPRQQGLAECPPMSETLSQARWLP